MSKACRDAFKSAAIVGISPTMTNSVVPIAKALSVNASSAKGIRILSVDWSIDT